MGALRCSEFKTRLLTFLFLSPVLALYLLEQQKARARAGPSHPVGKDTSRFVPLTEQEGSGNGYRLEGNRPARASPSLSSVSDSSPSDRYRCSAAGFSTSSAQIFWLPPPSQKPQGFAPAAQLRVPPRSVAEQSRLPRSSRGRLSR